MVHQVNNSIRLHLLVTGHEPAYRTATELTTLWDTLYGPLIALFAKKQVRIALHLNGRLLDHLACNREEILIHLKQLVQRRQLEVLGGLFYGGLPALLPEDDVRGQIQMQSDYWESVVGVAPAGAFFETYALCPELPRLVDGLELEYGCAEFPTTSQTGPLVFLRNGLRLPMLAIDTELSNALIDSPADTWFEQLVEKSIEQGPAITVRLQVNKLVLSDHQTLEEANPCLTLWLEALAARSKDVLCSLPSETVRRMPPTRRASLASIHGQEKEQTAQQLMLYQRMLHVSTKLRQAISFMDDEKPNDEKQNQLATAQRLLFAAQSAEPYLTPNIIGSTEKHFKEEQDVAETKLIRAETMMDGILQEEPSYFTVLEKDADGDANPELFIANRHLATWIVPKEGGALRTLDNRSTFHNYIVKTPWSRRNVSATCEWVVEQDTSPEELFSGSALELFSGVWKSEGHALCETGYGTYALHVHTTAPLTGNSPRELSIDKIIHVPIDEAFVRVQYEMHQKGSPNVIVAAPFPISLPSPLARLLIDGREQDRNTPKFNVARATSFSIETQTGKTFSLTLSQECELWIDNSYDSFVWIVVIIPVDGDVKLAMTLEWPKDKELHLAATKDKLKNLSEASSCVS